MYKIDTQEVDLPIIPTIYILVRAGYNSCHSKSWSYIYDWCLDENKANELAKKHGLIIQELDLDDDTFILLLNKCGIKTHWEDEY